MDTTTIQRFKDALGQHDRVAILVGRNPNIDEMAAALSMYLSLKLAQKPVVIASATQPIVELSSLVGIDEVRSSLGSSGGDLVVSFPYQEGAIEKVSYTIENGSLNIVVKAGEQGLAFQEQDVRFTRGGGLPSLIITVGVPQLAALGDLYNAETLKDASIINIDTKADNEGYGDIVLVSPQYSSLSEFMAQTILSNGLSMDVDIAQNLLNGILFATNNFQSPTTSYFAFEIVAELMRRGAVRPMIQAPMQPTPSYMQQPQQPRPQQQQRQTQQQPQQHAQNGAPRQPFAQGQQRSNQQQNRQNQRPQQRQQGQQQQAQQPNNQNRQDEIRRALAEQARAMQQQQPQMNQQPMQQPAPQPMPEPTMPIQQPQPDMVQQPTEAPSDWLTPKVYKGSSQPS